ncbi:TolC family protein [Flavobacteriaceae bacterium]|nr:TolC family protein [Flavobacteriaceae bacterium]
MHNLRFLFVLLFSATLFSQQQIPIFDGVVSPNEWKDAQQFSIDYEINPGDNSPAPHKTEVYVLYSATDMYVGFIAHADMSNLRSSIRNRDEGFQDDNVQIGIDTYGDGRYMILLGANPEGNQIDLKLLPDNEDDYDVNFESKASKHADSYHVELKIPFNVLPFIKQDEMKWKVVFVRTTYTDDTRSQSINFKIDRDRPCFICQTPTGITLKGIQSKNRVNLLPYVFGGLSGEKAEGQLDFGKFQKNAGLSGLFDLNSVTSLEFALNPDFSQVEADVSQVNANTTFSLFFPERRPYFNEGNEIINSNLNTVYTRTINDPLASTKIIHQGDKQRVYWLAAYDQASPYLIAGENESFSGAGGKAFSNILSYQRTFDQGSYIGLLSTNRIFKDGGNGHAIGVNCLLPKLKLNYNLINEQPIQNTPLDIGQYKGGLSFSMPLFLRKERGALRLAKLKLSDARYTYDLENIKLKNKLRELFFKWQNNQEILTVSNEVVKANKKLLKAEERKFYLGESSLFMVNSREQKYLSVQLKQNESLNQLLTTKVTLLNTLMLPIIN